MWNEYSVSAKLLLGNWRAASDCWPLSLSPNKHPYLFLLGHTEAHVGEILHHIGGACLLCRDQGSWWEVVVESQSSGA